MERERAADSLHVTLEVCVEEATSLLHVMGYLRLMRRDDVLVHISLLKCSAFLGGDLNDFPSTSRTLRMATQMGVTTLTPNTPTTMAKNGIVATKEPIDHLLCNRAALDVAHKVKVDYRLHFSHHFPLIWSLSLAHPVLACPVTSTYV